MVVAVLLAAGLARPGAAVQNPPGSRQVNARQLMRVVESAYEDLMRAAQLSGARLDPKEARNRPFWSALDRMGRSVEEVGTALRARDARFYQSLERGSVALGELRVIRARSGVRSPEVDRGLGLLASSYRLLRRTYGSEQARFQRGGGLSESERQRLERIQAAQRDFAGRLEVLRKRAGERKDRATVAELNRLIAEAYRIASAPLTLESYLKTLIATDEMRGEWAGNRFYADPVDKAGWAAASQVVEELHVEAEVGHLFVVELGSVGDWSHLNEPAELPVESEAAAPAVQVFVPGEETAAEGVEIFESVVEEEAGEIPGILDEGVASEEDTVPEEIPAVEETSEESFEEEEAEEGTAVFEEEVIQEEDIPASEEPKPEPGPPPPQ